MSYDPVQASTKAMELVSIALQSGSITLSGTHKTNIDYFEKVAKADAKYLEILLTELSAAIQKLP